MNLAIGCSAFLAVKIIWVKIVMLLVAVSVSIYIASLNTIRDNEAPANDFQET